MSFARSLPALVGLLAACGRSGLGLATDSEGGGGQGGTPSISDECATDADCAPSDACSRALCENEGTSARRTCQSVPLDCGDGDPCSLDRCDPNTGCVHERPTDGDHDGFVGKAPQGLPASCGGPDCDDTNANIHPGAVETCDGKDDDCNGAIDDGSFYTPAGAPVLVARAPDGSEVAGLAFDGASYALTYKDTNASFRTKAYFELMNANGQPAAGPVAVSEINADTFAGSLDFSGKSFLTAWNDARQAGNYEIYFTRFDQKAQKLSPDQRLTNADGFSLSPVVRFTGSEYVVLWQDQRLSAAAGRNAIFAHRLSEKGDLVGSELQLTDPSEDADFVDFDVSGNRLGVAYVVPGPDLADGSEQTTLIRFRTFDLTLGDATGPFDFGSDGQEPSVVGVNGGFVIAWHTGSEQRNWGPALEAAAVDGRGVVLAAGAVTSGDTHAKQRTLVSFGDRVLVIWSATPTEMSPFALSYETIGARDLSIERPRAQLVANALGTNLVGPKAVRGSNGDVGITYEDANSRMAYFVRLGCGLGAPPPAGAR